MNKFVPVVVLVAILGGGYYYWSSSAQAPASMDAMPGMDAANVNAQPVAEVSPTSNTPVTSNPAGAVKEFTMTAFYDEKGAWFSLKDMTVKKGDTVRVKVTNTKGMHDFTLDEFNINKELPLNEEVTIEFTADKVGEFQYYCAKPGHRQKGQWGTLKVEG